MVDRRLFGILAPFVIFGLWLVFAPVACTDIDGARSALERAGYTNVRTTGYSFFGCDEKDTFHTGFEAVGPTGESVEGVVCSGWLKGKTIRIY